MDQQLKLTARLEFIWWIITGVILIAVLFPIYSKMEMAYPFYWENSLFIILFVTFSRLIFLLDYSFLVNWEKIKIALVAFTPIIIFFIINEINSIQVFLDEKGVDYFYKNQLVSEIETMRKYISGEVLFFGVGSVIAAFILPFRLIHSIWRGRNLKTN
jgi:hypothetical protein